MYDMHCHVARGLDSVCESRSRIGITHTAVFIPPEPQALPHEHVRHYTYISTDDGLCMNLYCQECQRKLVSEEDLFFRQNQSLYLECQQRNDVSFFALVPVLKRGMQRLLDRYRATFPNIKGFKIYTGISESTLDDAEYFQSDIPLIIHTGTFPNQNPSSMLRFLSGCKCKVMLAHFARFDDGALQLAKSNANIYYDVSPAVEMFRRHKRGLKVFLCKSSNQILSVNDMYCRLIDAVGVEHIMWGSDAPYSDLCAEFKSFNESALSDSDRAKILLENPMTFLSI